MAQVPARKSLKSFLLPLLKGVVTTGLLIFIAQKMDWSSLKASLTHTSFANLLAVWVVLLGAQGFAGGRWYFLRPPSLAPSPVSFVGLAWVGGFFSQCLPGSMGGDVYRAFALKKGGASLLQSIISLLLDRGMGFISLGWLCLLGFLWENPASLWGLYWGIGGGLLAMLALFLYPWILERIAPWFLQKTHPLLRWISHFLQEISLFLENRRATAQAFLMSLGNGFCLIAAWKMLFLSQHIDLPLSLFAFLIPLIFIAEAVPLSLAGWGVREGMALFLFTQAGFTQSFLGQAVPQTEVVVTVSLFFGFLQLVASLPGLVVWLLHRRPSV